MFVGRCLSCEPRNRAVVDVVAAGDVADRLAALPPLDRLFLLMRSQLRLAPLRQLLGKLEAGDVVMVTRLDRLARSTRDLLNTLAAIADRKAGFRSLADTGRYDDIARAVDADRARRPSLSSSAILSVHAPTKAASAPRSLCCSCRAIRRVKDRA
jgi:hypothetical protein